MWKVCINIILYNNIVASLCVSQSTIKYCPCDHIFFVIRYAGSIQSEMTRSSPDASDAVVNQQGKMSWIESWIESYLSIADACHAGVFSTAPLILWNIPVACSLLYVSVFLLSCTLKLFLIRKRERDWW